ncbi:MAG: TlpA disulfide reductase family protein [Candidatus Zixiibacteriota bacterium]
MASCFLVIFFLFTLQCGKSTKKESYQPAFDFSLADLTGKIHSMAEFNGQITVINFWATWCPPCVEEVPKLNRLYGRYKTSGVQIIGIAMDKDSLNLLDQFVKKNTVSYLILVGNEQALANLSTGALGKNFQGIPTTLLLDKKGQIYKRFDGSFDTDQLEEGLKTLLNQK